MLMVKNLTGQLVAPTATDRSHSLKYCALRRMLRREETSVFATVTQTNCEILINSSKPKSNIFNWIASEDELPNWTLHAKRLLECQAVPTGLTARPTWHGWQFARRCWRPGAVQCHRWLPTCLISLFRIASNLYWM